MTTRRISTMTILALSTALLVACGGAGPGGDTPADAGGTPVAGDPAAPPADPVTPPSDPVTPPPTDPVTPPPTDPVTPPPTDPVPPPITLGDWVLRESFGMGENYLRPAGNGGLKETGLGDFDGFWVEYPGAGVQWTVADEAWQFAGCSADPLEPATPLGNGCAASPWTDALAYPDAIVPFEGLAGQYQVSADLYPAFGDGAYVAIGLTSSAAIIDNLRSSGQLWLRFWRASPTDSFNGRWELRAGALDGGTVLASGSMFLDGYNPVAFRYDPVAQNAYATIRGETFGPFSASVVAPRFLALEGQGVLDNLQIRPVVQ